MKSIYLKSALAFLAARRCSAEHPRTSASMTYSSPIRCRASVILPDSYNTELNPKTWTVSVNRLFDTQSGILPG